MIRGGAPNDLLDSYTGERQPVALQILDCSRAQVALYAAAAKEDTARAACEWFGDPDEAIAPA